MGPCVTGFFYLAVSSRFNCVVVSGWTTFCLSVHELMDTGVVSTQSRGRCVYAASASLGVAHAFISLGQTPRRGVAGSETATLSRPRPGQPHRLTFPPAGYEVPLPHILPKHEELHCIFKVTLLLPERTEMHSSQFNTNLTNRR